MELRYLGFEQRQNARAYRFDGIAKGEPIRRFVVTADMTLFQTHRIAIQDGPSLCASKLSGVVADAAGGNFELTDDDLRAHADARKAAEARKAEMRKAVPRRHATAAPGQGYSPWRGSRP